jgi:hypothetical protein
VSVPQQVIVSTTAAPPAPLWAAWTDGILGNRDRMIQFTAVIIAIGIFILHVGRK